MEPERARDAKAKLFVIDDSVTGLSWAQAILENAGYEVFTYKSPLGVTRELNRLRPDLILLDVNMPSISGDKICKLLRTVAGALNPLIILYSSKASTELEQLAKECGADGYVSKSREAEPLLYVIRDRLAKVKGIGTPPPWRPSFSRR